MQGITLAQQWTLYLLMATHDEGTDLQGNPQVSKSRFRTDVETAYAKVPPGGTPDLTAAFWDTAHNLDNSINISQAARPPVAGLDAILFT